MLESNHFALLPIKETAILFVRIFATIVSVPNWLVANARRLGSPQPGVFYFGSGALSSVIGTALRIDEIESVRRRS